MSQLLEDLKAAREKIADPTKWVKGDYFATSDGSLTDDPTIGVCCMCALGAAACATGYAPRTNGHYNLADSRTKAIFDALDEATKDYTDDRFSEVAEFNDAADTTHEQILAVYDLAINLAINKEEDNNA